MTKGKYKIVYVASQNYGDNDAFLPILLTLAHQGARVKIVFQNRFSFEAVKASSVWWNWITKFAKCSYLTTPVRKAFFLLTLFTSSSKKGLTFLPGSFAANKISCLTESFCNIWHYKSSNPFDKKERDALIDNLMPEQRIAMGKPAIPIRIKKRNVKNALFLSRQQGESENEMRWKNSLIIFYPHMQEWWKEFIKANPPEFCKEVIKSAPEIITVILLRKGNYYFKEGSDVDLLLDEIVTVIRKYYPKTLVVLKPKFEWVKYWIDDEGLKERYHDENIIISYDSIIGLATKKTLFAVSTCQTSGNYYMLSMGIPVIEYGRYSDLWKEVFRPVTTIEDYGGVFAQDIGALDTCIKNISDRRIDVDVFKKKIGYEDVGLDIGLFIK